MSRDTHNRKNHDEIPSDDKEQDVAFENIVGMVKFQHQQLQEVRDTFEVNLTKYQMELQANLTKFRTELQENFNQLTNQIQMLTQAIDRLDTSSNRQSHARDSDAEWDNGQLCFHSNTSRQGYHHIDETLGIPDRSQSSVAKPKGTSFNSTFKNSKPPYVTNKLLPKHNENKPFEWKGGAPTKPYFTSPGQPISTTSPK
ncbi:hypothetical protein GOBAR_DD08575 [Gossypium barbadense]|nr:hypothetical protein GOBAR_DD08575 [Gossypium barbadense]